MQQIRNLERPGLVSSLLVLATLTVYLPLVHLGFLNFDDNLYVTANPQVQGGLTWDGLRWAFTHMHAANWHPLTWLSHMLDCQLYGLNPAGHHLTNFLFHAANTVLLFLWLRSLTGAFWRSAFVAALFALHPLHVESVAWVAERKDVLSAFFGLLSLWAYTRYAGESEIRNPKTEGSPKTENRNLTVASSSGANRRGSLYYALALLLFGLGLMSKPMLVTWPFVMLLLDYWPLGRGAEFGSRRDTPTPLRRWAWLVLEKLPFFALSAAASVVTVLAQRAEGAMVSMESLPLGPRILNALDAYLRYLGKLLWPADLAVIYPLASRAAAGTLLAGLLVVTVTLLAFWQRRRRPYLPVGWAWYLGTLVPVIGLVQVGNQSMADRYTYLPAIGLFIILAWGAADFTAAWPKRRLALTAAATAILAACALTSQAQLRHWQNTESLFRHTLAVTTNNFVAWNNLGFCLAEQGQPREAEACYRAAVEINPDFQDSWSNLGSLLAETMRHEEAIATYETALQTHPGFIKVRNGLATALAMTGRLEEAKAQCREAARIDPGSAEAHSNLGALLAREGQFDEAVVEFRLAVELDPSLAVARCGLGGALGKQGKYEEAVRELSATVKLQPTCAPARLQLGVILAMQGNVDQAISAFSELLRLNPTDPDAHYHLALAFSRQRNTQDALRHYRAAVKARPDFPEALNNLAWAMATHPDPQFRDGREAVRLANRACQLTGQKQAYMLGTLGAAYAEAGRFPEAVATAEQAKALAEKTNEPEVAATNGKLLELYRSKQPYRDTP